jgi:hypothetical protein
VPGFLDRVSLFAGTSTGGILALGLAAGLPPTELARLYVENAREIFDDSWLDDLRDAGGLTGADYDNVRLARVLARVFGERRLSDLPRRVLVSAFDLDNQDPDPRQRCWKPKFFHNLPGPDSDGDERVVDVALRSSAAPTTFPSYQGYLDGGVVANNPSLAALAQALDRRRPAAQRARLSEVALLSLGTGTSLRYIPGQSLDWGAAQWVKPLIHIMLEGSAGLADFQCRQLLGPRYHRLAPVFGSGHVIDDDAVNRIPELVALAREEDLSATVRWLKARW